MGNAKNVYFQVYIFCVAFGSTATSCQTYYQNKHTLYAVLELELPHILEHFQVVLQIQTNRGKITVHTFLQMQEHVTKVL